MGATALQERYLAYLTGEGYKGEVDEDGDIRFKYEGRWYYILVDEDDDLCLCVLFPDFWKIETGEERALAVAAANAANRGYKCGKLFTDTDDEGNMRIFAQISSFLTGPDDFKAFFPMMLDVLQEMSGDFKKAMAESASDETDE